MAPTVKIDFNQWQNSSTPLIHISSQPPPILFTHKIYNYAAAIHHIVSPVNSAIIHNFFLSNSNFSTREFLWMAKKENERAGVRLYVRFHDKHTGKLVLFHQWSQELPPEVAALCIPPGNIRVLKVKKC